MTNFEKYIHLFTNEIKCFRLYRFLEHKYCTVDKQLCSTCKYHKSNIIDWCLKEAEGDK